VGKTPDDPGLQTRLHQIREYFLGGQKYCFVVAEESTGAKCCDNSDKREHLAEYRICMLKGPLVRFDRQNSFLLDHPVLNIQAQEGTLQYAQRACERNGKVRVGGEKVALNLVPDVGSHVLWEGQQG
jgi:hypothetical protein